jgi:hypothetical protein
MDHVDATIKMGNMTEWAEVLLKRCGNKVDYREDIHILIDGYRELRKQNGNKLDSEVMEKYDERMCKILEQMIYPPIKNTNIIK